METIDLVILFIVLVGVGIILLIFYNFKTDQSSTDPEIQSLEIFAKSNPKYSAMRADFEKTRSRARTELNIQLAAEEISLETLVRTQDNMHRLAKTLEMEFAERIAKHITQMLAHENMQAALKGAIEKQMRLEFYEALTFQLQTGEFGKTLNDVNRKKLMDELEMKRLKEETEHTLNATFILDDHNQEKMKRLLNE